VPHACPLITSAGCCMSILSMGFLGGWTWIADGESFIAIRSCEDVDDNSADNVALVLVPSVDP